HIVFDLLDRVVPPGLRRWQHMVAHLVAAALFFGGAWMVHLRAARALEYGDVTAQLGIALGPFQYLITIMLALTGAIHLLLALRRIEEDRGADSPHDRRTHRFRGDVRPDAAARAHRAGDGGRRRDRARPDALLAG